MAATAGVLDINAMSFALKEYYNGQAVPNVTYQSHPFLAVVPKEEDWEGKVIPLPLIYSNSQGRSANFASAQTGGASQANGQASQSPSLAGVEFLLKRVKDYSIAWLDRETMKASASSVGAFVRAASTYVDSALMSLSRSLSSALFRSGTGSIAQTTSAGFSSGVATLTNVDDIVQIEVNQMLQFSTTDGGAVANNASNPAFVIAVNRDTGSFTVSASPGGAAGLPTGASSATQYFIYPLGDAKNNGSTALRISGLAAWLPSVAPTTGDNFFGIDRSVDTTRLAGVRYDGSAQSIEEALIDASLRLFREGGKPDTIIMGPTSFAALEKALSSKVVYEDVEVAGVGFRAIKMTGPTGPMRVFADIDCPTKTAYMLTLSTWVLGSLGKAPEIQEDWSTGQILRVSNADQGEVRCSYYAQLGCKAPGHNAVLKLQA